MDPEEQLRLLRLYALCIALDGMPHERVLFEEKKEGGDGGGGGGGAPPAKTFTQDEVNGLLAKERRGLEAKIKELEPLKEQAGKAAELEKQIADLTEKIELAGKSEKEREKLLSEKLQAQQAAALLAANKERDEFKTAAAEAAKRERDTRISYQATAALSAAKVLPTSMKHATMLFVAETQIETDDKTGQIASITYDGVPYTDVTKAAEAWLKANSHFASVPAGGAGSRPGNGQPAGKTFDSMSPAELAELGLQQRAQR